ncbi:DUF1822 family protein [Geminocystis sp. NIES-3709]|uniref:DUF1822 family protein n=1 Tax=Geminocystis sp. NIES-3709 TaxID=1617448 RepID=UPI0005FC910C|nr:DUF1822 family protein [Geminocystis sp. NIES-3709]BAQ64162.1 hypothetical protein GM3709_927 [Geminocystis sp. NIES-3709]
MSLDLFTAFNSEHLWLKFSDEDEVKAIKISQGCSPNGGRHQSFLNALVSICLIKWLKITFPNIYYEELDENNLLTFWEFVNGTPLVINNNTRLILLPEEKEDLTEFYIPQEWVDIPHFRGDYFLPIQVNLDTGWLRFWGFVVYEDVKELAIYDRTFFNYILPEQLVEGDLNLLWLFEKYSLSGKPECQTLPLLSTTEKNNLLTSLLPLDSLMIRHHLDFVKWGAIFSDDSCRQSLYQQYQPLCLGAWLQHNFNQAYDRGWQHLRDLADNFDLINDSPPLITNGIVMRSGEINLQYIYQIRDEHQLRIAAQRLSVLPTNTVHKSQAIQALNYIMSQSHDDETRWNAAEGIWRLEPNNPNAGLWCGKRINLGVDVGGFSLALVIGLLPKSSNENSIFLRLYSINDSYTLPINLKVNVMDQYTEVFKTLVARQDDRLLQYKFWGKKGECFWIQISLDGSQLSEAFII